MADQTATEKNSHDCLESDSFPVADRYLSLQNVNSYRLESDKMIPKIPTLCACGCNEIVWNGSIYKFNHHHKKTKLIPYIRELFFEGKRQAEIQEICQCSYPTINRALNNGLKLRYKGGVEEIPESVLEIIEGELLGDGFLRANNNGSSAYYRHKNKHKEYLDWLVSSFESVGLMPPKGYPRSETDPRTGSVAWMMYTKTSPIFNKLHEEWYPEGKKIVPSQFKLTPVKALRWFLGDGCLHIRKFISVSRGIRKKSHKMGYKKIQLSTDGFSNMDRAVLISEMEDQIGITPHISKSGRLLLSRPEYINAFYEYIGDCPINCYKYKWGDIN